MALQLASTQTININEIALEEWKEYRTEKKKPLSPLALKKTSNIMLKYGYDQQQVMVDAAISNDWIGLHAVDPPQQNLRQNTIQDDLTDRSWA
jgi:hypothetical protein